MTTNANKFGLRKAAAERSKKHAQRTPLPPKPGVIQEALDVIAYAKSADLAESHAENHGDAPDVRSWGKAKTFGEKAGALGWEVSIAPVAGAVEVTATRGAEMLIQAWRNGVWDYSVSHYAFGDRNTRPRNASGAVKLLGRSETDAAEEAGKVAANKHFRKAEPKDITVKLDEAQARLPFDPDLATDEEITGILAGQALSWYNRLSRGTESAIVGRKGIRITAMADGARVVHFCCPVTGYRSCLVTSILKVGRGRVAKSEAAQTVEVG